MRFTDRWIRYVRLLKITNEFGNVVFRIDVSDLGVFYHAEEYWRDSEEEAIKVFDHLISLDKGEMKIIKL